MSISLNIPILAEILQALNDFKAEILQAVNDFKADIEELNRNHTVRFQALEARLDAAGITSAGPESILRSLATNDITTSVESHAEHSLSRSGTLISPSTRRHSTISSSSVDEGLSEALAAIKQEIIGQESTGQEITEQETIGQETAGQEVIGQEISRKRRRLLNSPTDVEQTSMFNIRGHAQQLAEHREYAQHHAENNRQELDPQSDGPSSPLDMQDDLAPSTDGLEFIPPIRPEHAPMPPPSALAQSRLRHGVESDRDGTNWGVSENTTTSHRGRVRKQTQRLPGFVETPKEVDINRMSTRKK